MIKKDLLEFKALTDYELFSAKKIVDGKHIIIAKNLLNKVILGFLGTIITFLFTIGWLARDYNSRIFTSTKLRDRTEYIVPKDLITRIDVINMNKEIIDKIHIENLSNKKINKIRTDYIIKNVDALKIGQKAIISILLKNKSHNE